MKPSTHQMIELALDADDTLSAEERKTILTFGEEP